MNTNIPAPQNLIYRFKHWASDKVRVLRSMSDHLRHHAEDAEAVERMNGEGPLPVPQKKAVRRPEETSPQAK